jgi:anti-sigma regulatory factor (Ser/Thr protein kinase)/biotin operon repressor
MTKTKDIILQAIKENGWVVTGELMKKLDISRQAINRHLNDLIRAGKIIKKGASKATATYLLNDLKVIKKFAGTQEGFKKRYRTKGLSEDLAFDEVKDQVGLLGDLSRDDRDAIHYAFTEMLNNAIDHSGSKFIDVDLQINKTNIITEITDKGVGTFENIRLKKNLYGTMDAIQDLLKGKQTTAPEYHSGEGIFFTSKLVDRFVLSCNGKRLTIDNRINDVFVEGTPLKKGTSVSFEIDLPAHKKLMDVFREYTNEEFIFDRSQVAVKLFDSGDSYISRSQAKRLLHSMEDFRTIVLDFAGVKTVGQGFADEVFRIYSKSHPGISIVYKNANEDVEFMITRALANMG